MHYTNISELEKSLNESKKIGKITFDLYCEFMNITHSKLITTLGRLISPDNYSEYVGYTLYYLQKNYIHYRPKKDLNAYAYIVEIAKHGMIDYHNMLKKHVNSNENSHSE